MKRWDQWVGSQGSRSRGKLGAYYGANRPHPYEELHARSTSFSLLDSAGSPTGYIGSCVDITLRKRQQAALQESEQRFRTIVRQAAAGVVQTCS